MSEEEDFGRYAIIGSYPSPRQAHEAGLAVLAAGHAYWVHPVEGRFAVVVDRLHANQLKREVDIAESKGKFWPPAALSLASSPTSKFPTAAFAALLIVAFYAQNRFPEITEHGLNSSQAVAIDGEWWRSVTAITLHADIGHLSGNLLGLGLFAYLCCRYMGNGLAWLSIIVAAALANLSNAFLNLDHDFRSLGASTAVFAALGLLTGSPLGSCLKTRKSISTIDWLVPFCGGCVLFAWMGGGEAPVDVGGHLLSFAYGILIALPIAAVFPNLKIGRRTQYPLLAASYATIAISWWLATH